jgi:hypothetical protein
VTHVAADLGARAHQLVTALQVAVPLHITELAALPARIREPLIERWAADAVEPAAHKGDALMFGGKRGEAAAVFAALARGLAALAYQPGGVTVLGQHWCTNHAACQDARAYAERINACPEHGPERPPARAVDTVPLPGVS